MNRSRTYFTIVHTLTYSFITNNGNGTTTDITKGHLSANSQANTITNTNCDSTYADMTSDDMEWDKSGADNRGGDDITSAR